MVSWASGTFYPWYFLLVLTAIVVNHVGLNMTDDYFDYKHSVDQLKPGEKNPYTGGSGTLSSGVIKPADMFRAFTFCYLVTVAAGLYLAWVRGLPVLFFGLVGVFCAVFYTAPPIRLAHHGLGELALLVNFGSIIGLGAYYVQAQTVTLEAFLATLPLGIMMFSMIVINEVPDVEEDRRAGKLTLVARFGKKAGIRLYVASWIATYGVVVAAIALQMIPVSALAAFLALPWVYRSIKTLRAHYEEPMRLAPANLDMIKAHGIACLGLIAGYAVHGFLKGADAWQLVFILSSLTIAYAPVAWMLTRTKRG